MSTREFIARRFGSTSLFDSARRARRGSPVPTDTGTPSTGGRTGGTFAEPTARRSRSRGDTPSFVGAHARAGSPSSRTGFQNTRRGPHRHNYHGTYYDSSKRRYYGFFDRKPVTRCYVPFGFYGNRTATTVIVTPEVYEEPVRVEPEPAPEERVYEAAAGSAAAERYMREASELFARAEYPEAARRFRLAAIAAPENAAPLFALGQALIPLENYPYAAKVLRQALDLDPSLYREAGDLGAVYATREEFGRVQGLLEARIEKRPDDEHAPFLLGLLQYYGGDPAAQETFGRLSNAQPNDRVVQGFVDASKERFKKANELPKIEEE